MSRSKGLDDWVEVKSYGWLDHATRAKARLAAAGIEARVPHRYMLSLRPVIGLVCGGARLLVHDHDRQRAADLLGDADRGAG